VNQYGRVRVDRDESFRGADSNISLFQMANDIEIGTETKSRISLNLISACFASGSLRVSSGRSARAGSSCFPI